MNTHKQTRLEAFVSLAWYEVFLRFIANFVAKSAELLLAAGLVVSTANFLTDGAVLVTGSAAFQAWGWIQSLAIDSSLGISFYYVLSCLKQRDWLKFSLYSILTVILTVVTGIITDGDIFSHANHTPIHEAMTMLGIDVRLLSILRSIAVVGFVLMSRLRDVSFKDLGEPGSGGAGETPTDPAVKDASVPASPKGESTHLTVEDVALLIQMLTRSNGTKVTEEPPEADQPYHPPLALSATSREGVSHSKQAPQMELPPAPTEPDPNGERAKTRAPVQREPLAVEREPSALHLSQPSQEPEPPSSADGAAPLEPMQVGMGMDREERLEQAYQELLKEGGAVSARRLAERAHVHRSTCVSWLRQRQVDENGLHEPQQSVQKQGVSVQDQLPVSEPEQESGSPERERMEEE